MRQPLFLLILLFWSSYACPVFAQNPDIQLIAVDDPFCIQQNEVFQTNVGINDVLPPPGIGNGPFFSLSGMIPSTTGTLVLIEDGTLIFTPAEGFCGIFSVPYRVEWNDGGDIFLLSEALIQIEVKCDVKPNCELVDLSAFTEIDPVGQEPACIDACELSTATYFLPFDSNKTYNWSISGGTFLPGTTPAEILVQWGPMGTGLIQLITVDNVTGATNTFSFCVDLLDKPIADFSYMDICIGQDAEFMDLSVGATDWFWDFGDGFTSNMQNPIHTYGASGPYTVTLIVTKANLDQEGNPLCCCTDTLSQVINVDNLPGPNIECVSTVCAGETQVYTTDADCTTLNWSVFDAAGSPYPFAIIPPNGIQVNWGNGPTGTVVLDVDNCNTAYCPLPTTVTIPIIGPAAQIYGPEEVCAFETATYTTDKYHGTTYNWTIPDGSGTIISDANSNVVTVTWGPGPIGNLELDIFSDFLDCGALGSLPVEIKPDLQIFGQTAYCDGDFASFNTNHPGNLTWTLDFPGSSPFVGNTASGTLGLPAGTYQLCATPDDPSLYCVDSTCIFFTIFDVDPPLAIDGPLEVCPGEVYTYYAQSSETGVQFNWTVTGSSSVTTFVGNPLVVDFDNSGAYTIVLTQSQLSTPFCESDPIQINPTLQELPPIVVTTTDGCVNQITSYTATAVPDATYNWSLSNPGAGSIIGQGNPNIDIQWNNQAFPGLTLTLEVTLCNTDVQTFLITVFEPTPPTIFQTGNLCPGVSATLDAPAGFSSYLWSTGGTGNQITITSGGLYFLTVTDPANGNCPVVASFEAVELEGPTAQITALDPRRICLNSNPSPVVLSAFNSIPPYTYTWYCNGTAQSLPPGQDFFTHFPT
ncbi:MAG: PKD domain-containing protein, partial [Bacteroidota bacterium]